jgi:hypothetical protein
MARRPILRVLLGTAPGLERFLLASVPAIVVGAVAGWFLGPWVGLGLALATLGIVIAASSGMSR